MNCRFCNLLLDYMYQCQQRGLWLSNIDEEQSEEWCNGVLERESGRLTNGAHSVFPSVSGSFQDDNLCSAQLPAPRSGFCGFYYTALISHLTSRSSLCFLFPFSYHPPSLTARLGSRTSPGGWIWGRFPVAVGCNPEVHAEPSQSPPWACHVPDLWHQASEGHIRLLWEEALLLEAGQTEQPAGQQRTGLERVEASVVLSSGSQIFFVRWTNVPLHWHHPSCCKYVHLNRFETGCYLTLLIMTVTQ